MSPSACHTKDRGVTADHPRPSASPEPAQRRKRHACHTKVDVTKCDASDRGCQHKRPQRHGGSAATKLPSPPAHPHTPTPHTSTCTRTRTRSRSRTRCRSRSRTGTRTRKGTAHARAHAHTHICCEPAQSKCISALHKSHLIRKFTRKMPGPRVSPERGHTVHTLCEPAWKFHMSHFTRKFKGKLPRPRVSTLIKHRPLLIPSEPFRVDRN